MKKSVKCGEYAHKRNYQSATVAFCIGLLNQRAVVTVSQQKTKSKITLPFYNIDSVKFADNDEVFFSHFVEEKIQQICTFDIEHGIKTDTATTRIKKNRIDQSLYFICDMLFVLGFQIRWVQFNKRRDVPPHEEVYRVFDGKQIYTQKEIETIGRGVIELITCKLIGKDSFVFEKNNQLIQKCFDVPVTD
ncbi:hypothetical protein EIN_026480 [Entamoeba invadens IP1]|uniref:hypothetical protein n=1 Tax=Entamoeba invadens IP1 TaxID=370355 RepID=UPI0002C3CF55|nr:hypothetical protein EIN_026480 [Entamoeba invadens IP1]ELP90789.1 hypothetical protein EIN_026480 [Entamoeba invadens IP1]|eukprot:XP_004257560.1 hypothetical protein EIN_026480 [Entamoeba invadens IP1]